jgi:Skp family chaperone for outer membrane proteins
VDALSFDVTSAVNIGFANGKAIFSDKKTQKVVADAVMNEIKKQLQKIK